MSEMTDVEKAAAQPRLWEDWKTVDFKQTSGWFNIYERNDDTYLIKESPGVLIQELQESYYFWFKADKADKADKNGDIRMQREYCDREALGRRRVVFSDIDECNELVPSLKVPGYVETVNREGAEAYEDKNDWLRRAEAKADAMRKEQESRNDRITL